MLRKGWTWGDVWRWMSKDGGWTGMGLGLGLGSGARPGQAAYVRASLRLKVEQSGWR